MATAHPCFWTTTGKPARKNERREKRRREHTTERRARRPSRGSWNVTPAAWKNSLGKAGLRGALACWHSALQAVTQVRVCSSQTRNLSLSFFKLLVATCGVQTLQRPGKPNSSRHATNHVTTEACIIAHAERATLSPAPANCLSLVLLPVRS